MSASRFPPSEPLLALSRQDAYLQAQLQALLDAQSEGLIAGLNGAPRDDASSAGSRTPTTTTPSDSGAPSFSRPRSVVPTRQPKVRKIGLRGSRRGIGRTMDDLARLKDEEARLLEDEMAQRDEFVSSVDGISARSDGLRGQISRIEHEPANTRIAELKTTEKALDAEIHEMETRLFEMKARHRHLVREIQSTESSVQSKLSSYQNALQLAEKEAKDFLARPPTTDTSIKDEGFYALPAQRRTLQMAREHFQEEQRRIERRAEDVSKERDALKQGGDVWQDVLKQVGDVEMLLQEEMRNMQTPQNGKDAERGVKRMVERMRDARNLIEASLRTAEDNDWKLLICCIGAELEALIEGQDVLRQAFKASEGLVNQEEVPSQDEARSAGDTEQLSNLIDVGGWGNGGFEDDEDGPGPDLLISPDDESPQL